MARAKHRHLLNGVYTGWNRPVGRDKHDHMVSGRDRVEPALSGKHKFEGVETGDEI